MEVEKKEGDFGGRLLGALSVIFIVCALVYSCYQRSMVSTHHRYTIGKTLLPFGNRGKRQYEIVVKGVKYTLETDKSIVRNGRRYFVRYYAYDPTVYPEIVSTDELPDCMGDAPSDGWDELPPLPDCDSVLLK